MSQLSSKSRESGEPHEINLGNATVIPVSGLETVKVHSRKDLPVDEDFSRAVGDKSKTEKGFYERAVLSFAEKIIGSSSSERAQEILAAAKAYGVTRSAELEASGAKGQFGAPALRELLRQLRREIRVTAGGAEPTPIAAESENELHVLYRTITQKLLESSRGKFGISVAGVEPDGTAKIEVRQVTSPAYFALSKADMPVGWRERCMATGVCMIVMTSDNQLLVQYRTSKNAQYAEILGASIAGMFDARLAEGYADTVGAYHLEAVRGQRDIGRVGAVSKGVVGPISVDTVVGQIKTEAREELGLREAIRGARVVGVAEDLTKPHHEIVLLGEVELTTTQVVQRAKTKYDADKTKFDIPEWCVGIPATGEAVAILLTRVEVPLPPTHAAAFLGAGKALVLSSKGHVEAERWEADTVLGYRQNLERIDQRCRDTTGTGYNPMVGASQQGLGNPIQQLRHELEIAGLTLTAYRPEVDFAALQIAMGIELPARGPRDDSEPSALRPQHAFLSEVREQGHGLWCFDIDGVLTSVPEKVVNQAALGEIAELLRLGNTVALNTGRALAWAVRQVGVEIVGRALAAGVPPPELESRFVIVGEKGAGLAWWNGSSFIESVMSEYAVPDSVRTQIKSFMRNNPTDFGVELDEEKRAMLTLEMRGDFSHAEFERLRPTLAKEVEHILGSSDLSARFRVDATTIAVDVEHRECGKRRACECLVGYLEAHGTKNWSAVVTFGDSASDLDMANYFGPSFRTTHVHLGAPVPVREDAPFTLEERPWRFDSGTMEFLGALRS